MTAFKIEPDDLRDLIQSGVKGMKWGVRKEDAINPDVKKLAKRVAIDSKAQIKELNASYLDGKPPTEGAWKTAKYQSKVENIILNNLNQAHAQMTTGLVSKLNSSKQANRYGIGTRLFLDSKNREAAAKYGFKMTPQQQKLVSDRSKDAVVNSIVRVGWRFTALHLIAPMLHAATDAPDVDLSDIYFDVLLNDAGLVVDVVAGSHKEDVAEEVAQHMEDYGLTWQTFLEHSGVKGMKWGVRKDERPLGVADQALNVSQRTQVKVASSISALAAIGMSTNAAATLFQLQNRWEHLQGINAVLNEAQSNPLINDAGREALRATKNNIIKGIVGSAVATTAVSVAIGVVTKRTATAYFAPMHKVYGDVKPKINSDLRKLSKDIKTGKRPKMTVKDYNKEVASIVQKHMTQDKSNLLKPFHELARSQLGLQYNTKPLDIRFEKLPNTDLMNKMTVISPDGLVLVKAIKVVQHDDLDGWSDGIDLYFDYKFDAEGYISEFSCPTIEVAKDLVEGTLDVNSIPYRYNTVENPTDPLEEVVYHMDEDYGETCQDYLAHHGIKGMKWGRRRPDGPDGTVSGGTKDKSDDPGASEKSKGSSTPTKVGHNSNEDNFLSADADRFLKTRNKDQHEMSDREIKEAIGRAKAIDEYNKLFNPTAAQQMQDKLAALQAETQYNALQRQLNPTAIDRVNALVDKASGPYQLFTKIDGALDGAISSEIKKGVIGAFSTSSTSSSTHTPRPPREPKAPKEKKRGLFGGKKTPTETPTSPFSPGPRPSKPSPVFDITSMGKDDPVTAGWSSYTSSHPATPRALSAPSPSGRTQSGKSLIRDNLVTLQDHLDYMAQQKRFGYDS